MRKITQLCIGIVQFCLVILLGIVLVTAPYIFSPYSPRFYISHDTTLVNKVREIRSKVEMGRVFVWRELNVTFEYKKEQFLGVVVYCQRYDIQDYQENVEQLVDGCDKSTEFGEKIKAYQPKKFDLTPTSNALFLKSDIFGQYEFELLFAALLAIVYVGFTIVFEMCSIFYIEFRWRKYFTLVKSSQIPRPKTHRSDESLEPFVVQKANYDRFGRMTMKRGCLICPKLEEGETVQKRYEIEPAIVGRKTFRRKSGFWKVLAASSRHKRELMIQKIKVPFNKVIFSLRGIRSVLAIPSAMLMIVVVMLGLLLAFIYFQGPVMALSAICVISSIICLYGIAAIFEFFGGIVQLFTEQVVLTNSRVVFCWLERFNHKIEYLYYDDIELIELEDNKKLITVQVTDNLIRRLKTITSERNLTDLPMSFFQYLEYLDRDQVVRILEKIKEAKFAYSQYESDEEDEGQDDDELPEEGMGGGMGGMDGEQGRDVELQDMENLKENTIQLDLMAEDEEDEDQQGGEEGLKKDEVEESKGLLED